MYEALVPNLRFEARTLDTYLREAQEDAEARQLPIQEPDGSLRAFQVPDLKTEMGSSSAESTPAETSRS